MKQCFAPILGACQAAKLPPSTMNSAMGMVPAVTGKLGGTLSTMKDARVQATAVQPMMSLHLPRWKGPGSKARRDIVSLQKIGIPCESCKEAIPKLISWPKLNSPGTRMMVLIAKGPMAASHTALLGMWWRSLTMLQKREKGSALLRANAHSILQTRHTHAVVVAGCIAKTTVVMPLHAVGGVLGEQFSDMQADHCKLGRRPVTH